MTSFTRVTRSEGSERSTNTLAGRGVGVGVGAAVGDAVAVGTAVGSGVGAGVLLDAHAPPMAAIAVRMISFGKDMKRPLC
jgi:hypothetical protein